MEWSDNAQLMLEDARVDGVQLFDFRSKNMALPEGLPTVEEASDTEPAVVLNTLPDSATEVKSGLKVRISNDIL
ncbi:MAG: hypothetical protein ACLS36_00935 [Streptococcus sp.]